MLKGERIVLRKLQEKDEQRIAELAHDKTITIWTHVPYPYNAKLAKDFVKEAAKKWKTGEECRFAITLNDDFIGSISLIKIDKRDNRAEIGYWMGKPYRGFGYVTEASKLLIDYAFKNLKLHKVVIQCVKGNKASKNVIDKLGATQEGILRESSYVNKKYQDALYHGILRDEWVKS